MSSTMSFDLATIQARQARAAAHLELGDGVLLIGAGAPLPIPGGHDQQHSYRPHPEYYWLTGSTRERGVIAFDAKEGQWTHFVLPVSAAERLWEGTPQLPVGQPLDELEAWLKRRQGRPLAMLGCPLEGLNAEAFLTHTAQAQLDYARRPKDTAELALIKRACAATAAGFAKVAQLITPGMTERALQIELEAEMFRHGADSMGYGTIVNAGARAAILHGHPGPTRLQPDELVLIDAGGCVEGYTADVTRTFATGERLPSRHQAIYDIVLAALERATQEAQAGTEWHDVHRCAARTITQGLIDLGLLRGQADELSERGVTALFFPHGIGHMVGLGVRDVGGQAQGRPAGRSCCGARVRVDLPLEPGFVMTVEPGLYFVDALLDDPAQRERFRDEVCWDKLAAWRGIGGVRLEDDILILPQGPPEILTAMIPK